MNIQCNLWRLFCIFRIMQAALSFAVKGMDWRVPTSFGGLCNQVNSLGIRMHTQIISGLLALLQDITSLLYVEFIATANAELSCLILKKMRNVTSLEEGTWYVWITTAWNYNIICIRKGFLYSSKVTELLHCWRWSWSRYSAPEFHCGQLPFEQYCSAIF